MKSLRAWGKAGLVLLLLNEIRGIVVVISVLAAWSHANDAAKVSASASPAPPSATVHAARPPAAPARAGPAG